MTAALTSPGYHTTGACEHFNIGDISVLLRSDSRSLRSDFHALYGGFRCPQLKTGSGIRMEIEKHKSSWLQTKRHYTVHGDGTLINTARHAKEILPYLEWGIN